MENLADAKYEFGRKFQTALLYSIIKDYTFLRKFRDAVSPEFFTDGCFTVICQMILASFDRHSETPSVEAIELLLNDTQNPEELKDTLYYVLQNPIESFKEIEQKAVDFARTRAILLSQIDAEELVKIGEFDKAKQLVNKAYFVGTNQSIGYDYGDEETVVNRLESYDGTETAIPLGLREIDELLEGGSHRQEFGLCICPPSGGKTTLLTHIGATGVKAGFTVIHYSLEMKKQRVARRYDMAMTGMTKSELRQMKLSAARKIREMTKGRLIIHDLMASSANCDQIKSHLSRLVDEGTRPDLVILDYGDLLSMPKSAGEGVNATKELYKQIKSIATEFDCALWTASQTNKKSFDMEEGAVITGRETEGSLEAKFGTPDTIITGNQTYDEFKQGIVRYHLAKNREGNAKITIPYRIEYDRMTIKEVG